MKNNGRAALVYVNKETVKRGSLEMRECLGTDCGKIFRPKSRVNCICANCKKLERWRFGA